MTNATEALTLDGAVERAGSISALAREIGVSHQVMNRWVKKGYVPVERAIQIGDLYQIPARNLVSPRYAKLLYI